MTSSRQIKLSPALRVCAALWLLVWLAASASCSAESLFGLAESGAGHHSHRAAHHHDDVAPSHEDSGHTHDSDQGGDHQESCCTSLQTVAQFVNAPVLTKPDFGQSASLDFLWLARALTFVQPEAAPSPRRALERDWVFTHELCPGPAHLGLAPPVLA